MIYYIYQEIRTEIPKENHCLEEESYYYRVEGWFIFTSRIETTQNNADGIDWKCVEWEEEPTLAKSMFGQRLIHEKGASSK